MGSRHLVNPQLTLSRLEEYQLRPPSLSPFHHQLLLHQQLYGQIEAQGQLLSPTNQALPTIKKQSCLNSGSIKNDYAKKMEGTNKAPSSSRVTLRNAAAGEIVEVQGGHIIRSTGRKDRHSKVCTAKGPRDRRVRLSAHTAIQFYDVQDRLGYDRPSKAVDWLIKKAKPAIDKLAQLPAWKPTATTIKTHKEEEDEEGGELQPTREMEAARMDDDRGGLGGTYNGCQDQHQQISDNTDSSCLLPPSLHSDAIADTIKSFFPMGGSNHSEMAAPTTSSPQQPIQFQGYPLDLVSRSQSNSQDLRLSLQSFRDPMLMQSHTHHQPAAHMGDQQHSFFPGTASHLGFDNPSAGWADNQHGEMGRFQRLVSGWNAGGDGNGNGGVEGGGSGGFMFNLPPSTSPPFGQQFSQRGPLQSNNNPFFRAWINDPSILNATMDHHHQHQQQLQMSSLHPNPMAGIGFTTGFHIPARIQGEEEHDGNPNNPSSASSSSRH
ncbi:hypothetical protein Droror1_Dr00020011 [Drosera rotundifolia]